jgi:hypothetical protein
LAVDLLVSAASEAALIAGEMLLARRERATSSRTEPESQQ